MGYKHNSSLNNPSSPMSSSLSLSLNIDLFYFQVRGTLRGWTKFWCKLKPGWLVIYKSQKVSSPISFTEILMRSYNQGSLTYPQTLYWTRITVLPLWNHCIISKCSSEAYLFYYNIYRLFVCLVNIKFSTFTISSISSLNK